MDKQEIIQSFSKQVNVINSQIISDDYQNAINGGKLLSTYLSVKLREGGK